MKKFISILSLLLGLSAASSVYAQSGMKSKVISKVMDSVFEIVVEKHEDTKITYEKPLPMDKISFSIRNDKYTPIGTAFLMDDGKFYTAAHVINLFKDSVYDRYFIRDSQQNVYEVTDILSFSTNRDFICFSVKDYTMKKGQGLKAAKEPKVNTAVYSVGNALGEGIIIRDGIYTSRTFETEKGDWKWIRFSAAASPGNSGGPLILSDGSVFGIVTMKSQNENLNYALPFDEVAKWPADTGYFKLKWTYHLPNLMMAKSDYDYNETLTLPMNYSALHEKLMSVYFKKIDESVAEFKTKYSPAGGESFDTSQAKEKFFYNAYRTDFPYVLYQKENGEWSHASPKETQTYQLEDNGYVKYGSMMNYIFCKVRKPDSANLKELIENPKEYMDYIVKATSFYRTVGNEKIIMTSFGEPSKSETYRDYFDRTWFINCYDLDYCDAKILTCSMVLPTGFFVYLTAVENEQVESYLHDMKFMTDFVYPTYQGKLSAWKEYLNLPENLRAGFSELEKSFAIQTVDGGMKFTSQDFEVTMPSSEFLVDDETVFGNIIVYTKEDGKVKQHVMYSTIANFSTATPYYSYFICRYSKPDSSSSKEYKDDFEEKLNRKSSYSGKPFVDDDNTVVYSVEYPEGITYETRKKAEEIYVYSVLLEDQEASEKVLQKTELMKKNSVIKK